jgi:putative ABC transport system substrate-binding protein
MMPLEGPMTTTIGRRGLLAMLGGAAAAWPMATRAQQPVMPVVGFISPVSPVSLTRGVAALRKGLGETGYVEGRNVTVEYHGFEGQYDRLPALMDDLVRRRVAVIVAIGQPAAIAAKAATTTIPIVFAVGDDPVKLGLVASLAPAGRQHDRLQFFLRRGGGEAARTPA